MSNSEHEHATTHDTPSGLAPAPASQDASDNVTRNQGGQFLEESEGVLPVTWKKPGDLFQQETTDHVEAQHVVLDRAAAQSINAQRITMSNSGAKSMEARSIKADQSGTVFMNSERATLNQSSVVVGTAKELYLNESKALVATAGTATIEDGSKIGVLAAGNVEAKGNVHTFALFGGAINAGGNVSTVFTSTSAAALGAGFALMLVIARRLLGGRR
ncbi:MAG: hypothetical protein ACR2OU_18575 [Thermomicrobiales bacterium]